MDSAVTIERRLEAMRRFHDVGVRTTCFISPIFPGITDPKEIILRARDRCNLVWLENLNLRGSFKADVMGYISERRPDLVPLYDRIYGGRDMSYWSDLDAEMAGFCREQGLEYVTNDDSMSRPFDDPPIVVNYFYHERIRKSSKNGGA